MLSTEGLVLQEVGELQAGYVNNMPAGSYLTLGGDHHLPRPLVFTVSAVTT